MIRSESSPTVAFPNLNLSEEEEHPANSRKERVTKKSAAFRPGNDNVDEIIPIDLCRWQTFTRPGFLQQLQFTSRRTVFLVYGKSYVMRLKRFQTDELIKDLLCSVVMI